MSEEFDSEAFDLMTKEMLSKTSLAADEINSQFEKLKAKRDPIEKRCLALLERSPDYDNPNDSKEAILSEIISKEMSYDDLAKYAAQGWMWVRFYVKENEWLQAHHDFRDELSALLDEHESISKQRDELMSFLSEVTQQFHDAAIRGQAITDGIKAGRAINSREGGKKRDENTGLDDIRKAVQEEWKAWPNKSGARGVYKKFALRMVIKHPRPDNGEALDLETIHRWRRELDGQ